MEVMLEERAKVRKAVGQRPLQHLWSHSSKNTQVAANVSGAGCLPLVTLQVDPLGVDGTNWGHN